MALWSGADARPALNVAAQKDNVGTRLLGEPGLDQ